MSIADGAEMSISSSVSVFIAYTGLVSITRHSAAHRSFFIAHPSAKSLCSRAKIMLRLHDYALFDKK